MRRGFIICFAIATALLVAPARAFAVGAYSIDELSTEITAETNGTLHVVERQTLTFDDRNAGVTWYLHVPEDGESVRIASVRVAPVDDGGTLLDGWTRLQMVDSNPEAQGRNPGDTAEPSLRTTKTRPWYSFNIGDGMMRCYFPTGTAAAETGAATDSPDSSTENDSATDEIPDYHTYVIETDYTIAHRVRVYRDVAELYWRYAHDSLPADARNVNLQVILPVPADTDPIAAADSIRAWGHGPGGTFAIGEGGTVTYRVDELARGNYAEAHVIFPASWMTNMAANAKNQFTEVRGPSAIAEESEWVDTGLREAAWDNKVRVLFLSAAIVVILIGAVAVFRRGRSPLSRRALVRVAATLAIMAAGEQLFFREPLTTILLAALAVITAFVALALPLKEPSEEDEWPRRTSR